MYINKVYLENTVKSSVKIQYNGYLKIVKIWKEFQEFHLNNNNNNNNNNLITKFQELPGQGYWTITFLINICITT